MFFSFQDVQPNSPADIAGLRSNTDYIIGADSVLHEVRKIKKTVSNLSFTQLLGTGILTYVPFGAVSSHLNTNFCAYYCTHKNRAVRKNMEATWRVCEGKACILCEEYFISLNHLMNLVVKVLLKCSIHSSTSFCCYTFPNCCMQISPALAYGVHISSKASATAVQ